MVNVQDVLNGCQVAYEHLPHRPTFDAQRLAEATECSTTSVRLNV